MSDTYAERLEEVRLYLIEGTRLADRCGFRWELDTVMPRSDSETLVLRIRVGKEGL